MQTEDASAVSPQFQRCLLARGTTGFLPLCHNSDVTHAGRSTRGPVSIPVLNHARKKLQARRRQVSCLSMQALPPHRLTQLCSYVSRNTTIRHLQERRSKMQKGGRDENRRKWSRRANLCVYFERSPEDPPFPCRTAVSSPTCIFFWTSLGTYLPAAFHVHPCLLLHLLPSTSVICLLASPHLYLLTLLL